jgi:hypothetical protein
MLSEYPQGQLLWAPGLASLAQGDSGEASAIK